MPANAETSFPLNSAVRIDFAADIDPATINPSTIKIAGVTGTVTSSARSALFRPTSGFAEQTAYAITVTTGVHSATGAALAAPQVVHFTTTAANHTAPAIMATQPADSDIGVALNNVLSVTFSEAVDPATLTSQSFFVSGGVTGTVVTVGPTAVFIPQAPLAASTTYTFALTTAIHDLAGNALAANHFFHFTTGIAADTTPPTIVSVTPAAGANDVSSTTTVAVTFSEPVDPGSLNAGSFFLSNGVSGTISVAGSVATLKPSAALAPQTAYTVVVTTGATDNAGNALAQLATWTFTTKGSVAPPPPFTITYVYPQDGAINVAVNAVLDAQFSLALDPNTVTDANFDLETSAPFAITVSGAVGVSNGNDVQFTPTKTLRYATDYTWTVSADVASHSGALFAGQVIHFTTATAPPLQGAACLVDTDCDPGCATGTSVCVIQFADASGVCQPRCIQSFGVVILPCPVDTQVCTSVQNPNESGYPEGYCGSSPVGGFSYCH